MANVKADYHEDVKDKDLRIMLLVNQLRLFETIAKMRLDTIDEMLRNRYDAVRIVTEHINNEVSDEA